MKCKDGIPLGIAPSGWSASASAANHGVPTSKRLWRTARPPAFNLIRSSRDLLPLVAFTLELLFLDRLRLAASVDSVSLTMAQGAKRARRLDGPARAPAHSSAERVPSRGPRCWFISAGRPDVPDRRFATLTVSTAGADECWDRRRFDARPPSPADPRGARSMISTGAECAARVYWRSRMLSGAPRPGVLLLQPI